MILELDADSIIYRVGSAVDAVFGDEKEADRQLKETMSTILRRTKCSHCKVHLGTSTNYRDDVATILPYKGNRDGKDRPSLFNYIRERAMSQYDCYLAEGQEAEDTVGINAHTYDSYDDYIVGAIDKDMKMIAGTHYNYMTGRSRFIDKYEALRSFYLQLATGDKSVDNIPGLHHLLGHLGLTEEAHKFRYSRYKSKLKAALAEMTTEQEMWEHVRDIYDEWMGLDKHGDSAILEIGQLLWIRRYEDEIWTSPDHRDFSYIELDKRTAP